MPISVSRLFNYKALQKSRFWPCLSAPNRTIICDALTKRAFFTTPSPRKRPSSDSVLLRGLHSTEMSSPQQFLDHYFETTKFQLAGDKKVQLPFLRNAMELVYLRKRALISVDIEAFERNNNLVTEVGFAIYDPRDQGATMLPNIRTVHLIIKEHAHRKNGRFVPDNSHRCLVGRSHIVDLKQCSAFITELFQRYFTDDDAVLVGHNVRGDIKWLKTLVKNVPDNCPVVDTASIHKLSRKNNGSLEGILRQVEIPCGRLHNAANDAFYTLQALMAWCDPFYRRKYCLDVYDATTTLVPKHIRRRMQFDDAAQLMREESGIHLYQRLWGLLPEPEPEPASEAESGKVEADA